MGLVFTFFFVGASRFSFRLVRRMKRKSQINKQDSDEFNRVMVIGAGEMGSMVQYLSNKKTIKFSYDPNVVSASYSVKTGLLVNPGSNVETKTGWYDKNHMPAISDEGSVSSVLPIVSSSEESSQTLSSSTVTGSESSGESSSSSEETPSSVSSELPQTSSANSHPGKGQGADQTAHSVVPVG